MTARISCQGIGGRMARPRCHVATTVTVTVTSPATATRFGARQKSGPYGYTQAKALYFAKPGRNPADVLRLHRHSISPTLPDGSVVVRTLAAPINPSDVNTIQGVYGVRPGPTSPPLGMPEQGAVVPGYEGCFEVTAVAGRGVSTLRPGDWAVAGAVGPGPIGSFRTHALIERADAALQRVDKHGLPGPLAPALVSVNPCSAYRMLRDYVDLAGRASAGAGEGAWFVQNAANSGVGRAAVQLGAMWGLRSINVVRARATAAETDALRAELTGLGATVVVTEDEFLDGRFRDRLHDEWTRGGRDPLLLGLDGVGGRSEEQMVRCMSEGGCVLTYGGMARETRPTPRGAKIFKRLRLEGFWLSAWARENVEAKRQTIDDILGLVREGKFRMPPVQEVRWDWDTEEKTLGEAVQGSMEGFRAAKAVFVFGET